MYPFNPYVLLAIVSRYNLLAEVGTPFTELYEDIIDRQLVLFNKFFVWCEIKFPHIPAVHNRVAVMSVEFTIICKIVFGTGNSLQVGSISAYHPSDKTTCNL